MLATISKGAFPPSLLLSTAKSQTQAERGGEICIFFHAEINSIVQQLLASQFRNIPPLIRVTLGGQKQRGVKVLLGEVGSLQPPWSWWGC